MANSKQPFVAFDAAVEHPKRGEAEAIAGINRSMRGILETTWADYGHAVRSVHAKSHGLLQGEFHVLPRLPGELAQGVFARPHTYLVVLRISTNPGDILDDTVSSPRGLALKIIGVDGERLPGSESDATQDFVMVNGPAFVAPDATGFGRSLKLLAATTDTGQAWKRGLSKLLRGAVSVLSAAGGDASKLKALGGQPLTHPLGETFYTQTPFRYGDHVAKLSVTPVSPALVALKDAQVSLARQPNGLRAAVIEFFATNGGEWELRVQLRTNPATMPIEDASVVWPEDESPYRTVARIVVAPQPAWNETRAQQVDDGLSFSPWHGIAAHRPLGSINRARKEAYALSAEFRAAHNCCPIQEPRAAMELSSAHPSIYGDTGGREGRRPGTPDARLGKIGQPLNPLARKAASGAVGGFAAGALLSVLFGALEAVVDDPSDLVKLERRTGARLGRPQRRPEQARPTLGEQGFSHGGHLVLSTATGAVYGLAKPAKASPLLAGSLFGAGFYAVAFGAVGPLLRVTPKLSREKPGSLAQHGFFHLLFGVTTALVADRFAQRL